ncbi:MAG: hypothetical protein JXQ75_19700 [Phycisphaerae bacterium]|nr:hypothetical protein [Phycisphaerae bacterium]
MKIHLGVDVGAVGIKAALVVSRDGVETILRRDGARAILRLVSNETKPGLAVLIARYRRTRGRPLEVTRQLLAELLECVGADNVASAVLTGSGSTMVAEVLKVPRCNEFQATTRAIDLLHPHVRTVFEIGGETSKYLRLEPDPGGGTLGILDYGTNGDCAAGTGAFLDQQASRLQHAVEDIGMIVKGAARAAQIAGRCSVFAKSDMIHAQQKGFTPPEVLRGLCNAVATNYKSAVVRGRTPVAPIAFIGGVSANAAVVQAMREAFEVEDGALFVPEAAESLAAVGAAMHGYHCRVNSAHAALLAEQWHATSEFDSCKNRKPEARQHAFPTSPPLSLENVKLLRDRVTEYVLPGNGDTVDAYLGLDIGSVGTKLVLIDGDGDVIHSIFTRTEGRPIEVVSRCLHETEKAVGSRVRVRAVGSTGSGRELIGELVGADSINDEITAHKTGATFVGDRLLGKRPDTIFEVGGQDSKYISLEAESRNVETSKRQDVETSKRQNVETSEHHNVETRHPQSSIANRQSSIVSPPSAEGASRRGAETAEDVIGSDLRASAPLRELSTDSIVVDFTMNEACAAGTGSFLEERAEELGVSIKDEFSALALSSKAPIKLGERCTVFMERDVNAYMQRGANREDVIAGLAYSIGYNYINRVVRGRRIGDCVFFQGGTAYNDAVAAAFSAITGKEIIVPPHNAVLGAIGAALLAKEKVSATGSGTRFRGYDVGKIDYGLREFTCNGCGNHCSVQEFKVEGEKTYWGDKCSDRYRKRAKTDRKPVIPDLVALRHELLHADDDDDRGSRCSQPPPFLRKDGAPTPELREDGAPTPVRIGLPMAMYTLDLLPLWRRFFRDCGFVVVTSTETNKRIVQLGLDAAVAEPCFPIIVAHGHVADLVEKGVDYIWLPNILSTETKFLDNESHVCPWGQTLPFVVRQAPPFRSWGGRILCPRLELREGIEHARQGLVQTVRDLGVRRVVAERAFDAAIAAQRRFRCAYEQAGREALATLQRTGESGMVLVGRPYNIHDAGLNISVARKLRDFYGVNVLPIDALPVADVDVRDVNDNMYWEYGRKILAAAKIVAEHPNLHIIYITNFKCGPDSYLKAYIRLASGKPYLTLQFDGHSNDAGMMTRCEAYLDSKGILRWWRQRKDEQADRVLRDERSTSPRCPMPVPG